MRLVKADAIISWSHLKESRMLDASEYIECFGNAGVPSPYKLIFVSHRWITHQHPDPDGSQLAELKQRLETLSILNDMDCPLLIFYDYCSLPQRPRSIEEESSFHRDLSSLESLSCIADKFIILSEGYRDYVNRAWCFFEVITARGNAYFFSDQNFIRDELTFLKFLMANIQQITSYDFCYKQDASELEIIVAVFQHLRNSKVTHPEDMPLIKEQLVKHYSKRRLTSFGKLILGMNKYFDVEFAIMPAGSSDVFVCKPFFERPDWVRLPSLETNTRFIAGRPGPSLFALPEEICEEIGKKFTRGIHPLLRLSIPGIQDIKTYIEKFKTDPHWKEYVVDPIILGEKEDCFPMVDNIIHTVLELPPGFFVSKDGQHLLFFLRAK
jgi:hypothetical protein